MTERAHTATDAQHSGTVVSFDATIGLGEIQRDGDGARFGFHCIEIADGTRTIDPGTAVSFGLLSKLGRYEAARIAGA